MGRGGVGGALPFDVQPLSFLLCGQLFEEPFVGVRCLWKGETMPRFSSGWEWESGWGRGLSSQQGLRGWGGPVGGVGGSWSHPDRGGHRISICLQEGPRGLSQDERPRE